MWPREDAAPRIEQRRSALRAFSSTFARVDALRTSIKELRRDRASLERQARGPARERKGEAKKVDRDFRYSTPTRRLVSALPPPQSSKATNAFPGAFSHWHQLTCSPPFLDDARAATRTAGRAVLFDRVEKWESRNMSGGRSNERSELARRQGRGARGGRTEKTKRHSLRQADPLSLFLTCSFAGRAGKAADRGAGHGKGHGWRRSEGGDVKKKRKERGFWKVFRLCSAS